MARGIAPVDADLDAAPGPWLPPLREVNGASHDCLRHRASHDPLSSTAYASLRLCLPPQGGWPS